MVVGMKLVLFIVLAGFGKCTIDLNFKELQYVAGELENDECRKLAESLHQKKLFTMTKQKWTGTHEPNKTCLFLLLKYDRTEGKGKTFLDLAIRLRQIGRHDVAEKLSKIVYHEKALAIKENFLDDPYRKMIRNNSFLLDQEKPRKKLIMKPVNQGKSNFSWDAFWICMSIIGLLILSCVGFRVCCPDFGTSLWQRFASTGAVEMCNLCDTECERCWTKFKLNYEKYVVGNDDVDEIIDDEEKLLEEIGMLSEN